MSFSLPAPRRIPAVLAAGAAASAAIAFYFDLTNAGAFVFAACFLLFLTGCACPSSGRERALFGLFAALFSGARVAGRSYDLTDSHALIFRDLPSFALSACAFLALAACAYCAALLLHRALLRPAGRTETETGREGRFFLSLALVLALGSVPYLLLYAPGLNIADTRDQLLQAFGYPSYIGDGSFLSDHHPVLTTFLYAGFLRAGLALHGANAGQLLYSVCSLLAVSLAFAYLLLTLCRAGIPRGTARVIAVLYALWPVPALYAFNMCKDSSVTPFVLLYAALMIRLFRGPRPSRAFWPCLACAALMMMLLRKSAAYALAFSVPLTLPFLPGRRARTAGALAAAYALFFLCGALYARLGVVPGETREMLSIPLQQAARALRDETVTEEERAGLGRFMDTESAARVYDPRLSDPVKDRTNPDASLEDLLAFGRAWLRVGLRRPSCYVQAWMNMIYGYFYPSDSNTILCLTLNSPEAGDLRLRQDPAFSGLRLALHNFVYFRLRRLPALSAFFYVSGITWAFLFLFFSRWASRGFSGAAPFSFFLGILLICLLSPKSGEIRYLLPVLYALPAMAGDAALPGRPEGKP